MQGRKTYFNFKIIMQEQDIKTIQQEFYGVASRKLDSLLLDGYEISGVSLYHPTKHQHCFCTQAGFVGWFQGEDNLGKIDKENYINLFNYVVERFRMKYGINELTAKAIARQIAEFGENYKGIK